MDDYIIFFILSDTTIPIQIMTLFIRFILAGILILCITCQDCERTTCVNNRVISINKGAIRMVIIFHPLLHHPVVETITFRCS